MKREGAWSLLLIAAALGLSESYQAQPLSWEQASLLLTGNIAILGVLAWGALEDLKSRTIPNAVPAGILAIQLVLLAVRAFGLGMELPWLLERSLLGALVLGGGTLCLAIAFDLRGRAASLGGGDIKLLAVLGFAFGWERGLILLLLACTAFLAWAAARQLLAAALARRPAHAPTTVALLAHAATRDEYALPFAPALTVGTCVTMLCF